MQISIKIFSLFHPLIFNMLLCLPLLAFLHSCLVFQVFVERSHNVQSPELSGLTRLRTTGRHRCFRVHTGSVTLAKIGCPSTLEMAQIVQFGKPEARHLSQHLARAKGALGSCACGGRARWQRGVGMHSLWKWSHTGRTTPGLWFQMSWDILQIHRAQHRPGLLASISSMASASLPHNQLSPSNAF